MNSAVSHDVRGRALLLLLSLAFAQGASALVLSGVPADASAYCGQIPPPPQVTAASSCVHQPTNGLVLYFSFDASNSTAIVDDSGHGREGVVNGATWTPAGHRGGAYSFDGVNDEIRVPNHPSLNPTNGITLSAWVSIAGTGTYNGIVMLKGSQPGGNAGQYGLLYRAQVSQGFNGRMSFSIATSQTGWQDYLSSSNISLSTWHHLAGCYASGDLRFYIDGQPARGAMSNIVGRLLAMTGDLFIGSEHSFPSAEYFRGRIDEVRVYDRALPASEVALLASDLSAPVPVQMVESGGGACPGTLSRTWTATDACGNSTSATQIITLQPAPAPTLAGVPPDLVLNFGDPVPPAPLVTATSQCERAAEPSAGLLLYYPFTEADTAVVQDYSGHGHTGTVVGAVFTTNGFQGGAFSFDGSGDRIRVGRPPALVSGLSNRFTMSAWVFPHTVQDRYVAGRGRNANNDAVMYVHNSGKVIWIVKVAGQERIIFSPQSYPVNAWSHMAMTFDGSVLKCFIDGALAVASNITGAIEDNGNDFVIGDRHTLDRSYMGRIDEVRVYDRALSDGEVAVLGALPAQPVVTFATTTRGACPQTITRVWSAVDACGSSVAATQTITVVDHNAPALAGVPSNLTLACDQEIPLVPVVTAIDDRGYVALQFAEVYSGACPGVLTRTWTAFDECGNKTSAVQHIHLVAVDRDGDGVPDQFETGTGVYVSPTNTGTDPAKSDTDGDGYADGVEIVRGSDPNDPNSRPRGTDLDFDADLVSDVGVYNPQDGSWLVRQSGRGLASWSLGGKQFSPVPADYDGDGRTDPAVVAATSGKWLILAADGTTNTIKFNAASAVPAIGDFDGDGRTDLCLYDARKGLWLFYHTNASVRTIQFGTAGTVPVVGDYDGDGRDDIAVYQPAMGQWYMFRSREGFKTVQFGYAGAVPVAADYDGDGRDDVAVYESSTGRWYLSCSRAGFKVVQFGFPGATPVVADFDGDGRADPAVYSSGGSAWYILCSRDGFKTVNHGTADSMPLGAR